MRWSSDRRVGLYIRRRDGWQMEMRPFVKNSLTTCCCVLCSHETYRTDDFADLRCQFFHFWLTYSFTITSSSSESPLCTSITPSLFHSRLKTYLFHKSYPPPVVSLLPPGLPSWTIAGTVSSELLGFCFIFFLNFSFLGRALDLLSAR